LNRLPAVELAGCEQTLADGTVAGRILKCLPFDNTYACLPETFYAKLNPTPFGSPPYLIHANRAAAELIDLDPE